jgi:hypothetical protein
LSVTRPNQYRISKAASARRLLAVCAAVLMVSLPLESVQALTRDAPIPLTGPSGWAEPGALVTFGAAGTIVGYTELDEEGIWRAYLRRSNGTTTTVFPLFGNAGADTTSVSLSSSGQNIDVVWMRSGDQGDEIKYRRSTDAGATWSAPQTLVGPAAGPYGPRVARDGAGHVAVVWTNWRTNKILVKVSTDGGATFKPATALATGGWDSPSVAVGGGAIVVAYLSTNPDANPGVVMRRSTNNGAGWGHPRALASGRALEVYARAVGQTMLVAFTRWHSGDYWVVERRSLDAGGSWAASTPIAPRTGNRSDGPVLSARRGVWRAIYAQCTDDACSGSVVRYRRSTDNGATWSNAATAGNTGVGNWPSGVGATESGPVVVWVGIDNVQQTVYLREGHA